MFSVHVVDVSIMALGEAKLAHQRGKIRGVQNCGLSIIEQEKDQTKTHQVRMKLMKHGKRSYSLIRGDSSLIRS